MFNTCLFREREKTRLWETLGLWTVSSCHFMMTVMTKLMRWFLLKTLGLIQVARLWQRFVEVTLKFKSTIQFNKRNHTQELLRNENDKTVITIFSTRTTRSSRRIFSATSPDQRAWERSRRARGSWAPTSVTPASSPVFLQTSLFQSLAARDQRITAN